MIPYLCICAALALGQKESSKNDQEPAAKPAAKSAQTSKPTPYYPCDWETLLLSWMKHTKDFSFEDHAIGYLKTYDYKQWELISNDEFELRKARDDQVIRMKDRLGRFHAEYDMVLDVDLNLGQYNFDAGSFPIQVSDNTYWTIRSKRYTYDDIPNQLYIYFDNINLISTLKMEKEAANTWVKSRKNLRGDVDRVIKGKVRFKIRGISDNDRNSFRVEIVSATLYDHKAGNRTLASITRPASTEPIAKPPEEPQFSPDANRDNPSH